MPCPICGTKAASELFFSNDLLYTEEALWITYRAQDEEGNQVFGHPNGVLRKDCKAGQIECWMTAK